MKVVQDLAEFSALVADYHAQGLSIGYVPTMGYLHRGHASLIERARKENDKVVVSIFVNPIQFGPNEDLDSYPRDLAADSALCESLGADLILAPTAESMYPSNHIKVTVSDLDSELCGAKRPGHFNGVCTVLTKFFHLVGPTRVYMGQKDAQQVAIVKEMVRALNFPLTIVPCPIVREADGLALSSRNTYLSEEERQAALCLSQSLVAADKVAKKGAKASEVIAAITARLKEEPLARIDYVSVVDAETMAPVDSLDKPVLVAMAVYIGKTRLIDNRIYEW